MPFYSNFENYYSGQHGGASKRGCSNNFECFKLQEESNDRHFQRNFSIKRYQPDIKLKHPEDSILSRRYKANQQDEINYTSMFKDEIKQYADVDDGKMDPMISDTIEKQSFLKGLHNTNIKDVKFNSDQEIVDYMKQQMFFHSTFFEISDNIAKDKMTFNNPTKAINKD